MQKEYEGERITRIIHDFSNVHLGYNYNVSMAMHCYNCKIVDNLQANLATTERKTEIRSKQDGEI